MAAIEEAAEKKLKSRIRKLKKCNKDEAEKEKFFSQLGISINVSFPNKNPEKQDDLLSLFTNDEGKIVYALYNYSEEGEFIDIDMNEKDLKVIVESFADYKLQLE